MAKKKETVTVKGKSADELKVHVAELKKELFNLRFQRAQGETINTSRFAQARKEIAQILTHLRSSQAA